MNRVIKFRALDTNTRRLVGWHEAMFINLNNEGRNTSTMRLCEYPMQYADSESCFFEYMQFTGLTDKNGAEIYEGDILRVLHTDWPSKSNDDPRTIDEYMNDLSEKYLVGFEEGAFTMFYDGDKDSGHYIKCGTHGFIEVIGNIYENPELLQ